MATSTRSRPRRRHEPGRGARTLLGKPDAPPPPTTPRRWHPLFYTTPTDDGAIAVTCDQCFQATSCPDPWTAAAAITHHHCDPDAATAHTEDRDLALDGDEPPALHLLAGQWVASCPTCGFQLASATSQARCERRSRHRPCPVCHQEA